MIKSYFTIAVRNLLRRKFYALLNVIGLAIGVGCLIVAILYFDYHATFDAGHVNEDRIYRVVRQVKDADGVRYDVGTHPMAPHLKAAFPEIEEATRIINRQMWVDSGGDPLHEWVAIADSSYTRIFTLPMIQGDARTGLLQPGSCFIDEGLAHRLFGTEDPIGKTVSVKYKWVQGDYTVTGVMQTISDKTHRRLNFSFLSATFHSKESWREPVWDAWPSGWFVAPLGTYLLLREGASAAHLQQQLESYAREVQVEPRREEVSFSLQPFTEIHLHTQNDYGIAHGEDIDRVYAILGIGALVLLLACLNYINLVTAQSPIRSREVGLRKVSGAQRNHLVGQFLGESTIVAALAFAVALALAYLALPWVSELLDVPLKLSETSVGVVLLLPLLVIPAVGILAGAYPAFVLSSQAPAISVQGRSPSGHRSWLRTSLVVFQLSISGILIACTLVVDDQIEFIRNKDLGYRSNGLVSLPMIVRAPDRGQIARQADAIRAEVTQIAGVEGATFSLIHPWRVSSVNWAALTPEDGDDAHKIYHSNIEEDYFDLLDIPVLSGRLARTENPWRRLGEREWEVDVILNETAAKTFGWGTDAIGKRAYIENKDREGNRHRNWHRVVAVVSDNHNQSLHEGIAPVAYRLSGPYHYLLVLLGPGTLVDQMAGLEAVWEKFLPGKAFEFDFADDLIAEAYESELQLSSVFGFFSTLSIIVGCLGILGLVTYTAQQRTREIGIRKVLGASNQGVVYLLSGGFLRPAAVSFIVGFPIAHYLSESWLANFTYRIDIGIGTFAVVAVTILSLVGLTVVFQSWRSATADAIESIRHE